MNDLQSPYASVVDRLIERSSDLARQVRSEVVTGGDFLARFDTLSAEQQRVLVENRSRYGGTVIRGLIDRSREAAHLDAAESLRLAQLAETAIGRAECLLPDRHELEILAQAATANALRVQGRLREAAQTWRGIDARGYGCLDPLETAKIMSLRASFEDWRRDHRCAALMLRRAVAIISEHGGRLELTKALVKLSPVLVRAGEPEEGARVAHEACRMLQPGDAGRLCLMALNNLAYAADDLGEHELAESVLSDAQELYVRYGGPVGLARRDWILARCRIARLELAVAEPLLERCAREFSERGMPFEVALVGLDQLMIWSLQERWAMVSAHAEALVGVFHGLGVEPEALAALIALKTSNRRNAQATLATLVAAVRGAHRRPVRL